MPMNLSVRASQVLLLVMLLTLAVTRCPAQENAAPPLFVTNATEIIPAADTSESREGRSNPRQPHPGVAGSPGEPAPPAVLPPAAPAAAPAPAPAVASLPPCCQKSAATSATISQPVPPSAQATDLAAGPPPGIEEKLGSILPLDLAFADETGAVKPLKEFLGKPTMIALVYYSCPVMCNLIQGGVVDAVKGLKMQAGVDYNVLSISFDETDTPDVAASKKKEFYNALPADYPVPAWRFLTGSRENILTLTRAAGYTFQRVDGELLHPAVLLFVSPEGKIVRYLHGTRYLPVNVSLALTEAAEGRIGIGIRSVVSFCFTYDPAGKRYVLNILRISGTIILLWLGVFLFFLLRRPAEPESGPHGISESPKLS